LGEADRCADLRRDELGHLGTSFAVCLGEPTDGGDALVGLEPWPRASVEGGPSRVDGLVDVGRSRCGDGIHDVLRVRGDDFDALLRARFRPTAADEQLA
jgi:hypothetical protein